MIPKRMSFYWDGHMTWMRYMTLYSFRKFNPDWDIYLYSADTAGGEQTWETGELTDFQSSDRDYLPEIASLGVIQKSWSVPTSSEIYDKWVKCTCDPVSQESQVVPPEDSTPTVHKADLCKWQILSTEGGFFADMDILWLKPMEELWQAQQNTDVLFCLEINWMAIGFMGASPDCPLFKDVYAMALTDGAAHMYQGYGSEMVCKLASTGVGTGDVAVQRLTARYKDLSIVTLPDDIIYPYIWVRAPEIFDRTADLPPQSVGFHWFAGSSSAREWNMKLTADNYQDYNNVFTKYARIILQ